MARTPVLALVLAAWCLGATTPARADDPSQADVDDVLMSVVKEPDAREEGFAEEIALPPAASERAREASERGLERANEATAPGRARAAEARERAPGRPEDPGSQGRDRQQ